MRSVCPQMSRAITSDKLTTPTSQLGLLIQPMLTQQKPPCTGCAGIECAGATPKYQNPYFSILFYLSPQIRANTLSFKLLYTLAPPRHLSDLSTYLCHRDSVPFSLDCLFEFSDRIPRPTT
jgi:hypothetical protein